MKMTNVSSRSSAMKKGNRAGLKAAPTVLSGAVLSQKKVMAAFVDLSPEVPTRWHNTFQKAFVSAATREAKRIQSERRIAAARNRTL